MYLTSEDEIKFVIASIEDFKFACDVIERYALYNITDNLLFSAVPNMFLPRKLAELVMACDNPLYADKIRMQLQLHKVLGIQ
jgi:7-carboxy-7-deazaguanine synthase